MHTHSSAHTHTADVYDLRVAQEIAHVFLALPSFSVDFTGAFYQNFEERQSRNVRKHKMMNISNANAVGFFVCVYFVPLVHSFYFGFVCSLFLLLAYIRMCEFVQYCFVCAQFQQSLQFLKHLHEYTHQYHSKKKCRQATEHTVHTVARGRERDRDKTE